MNTLEELERDITERNNSKRFLYMGLVVFGSSIAAVVGSTIHFVAGATHGFDKDIDGFVLFLFLAFAICLLVVVSATAYIFTNLGYIAGRNAGREESDDFEHACDIELAQKNARLLNLTHGFYIDCAHCGTTEFFEGEWHWTDEYFCCECQQVADFHERLRRNTRKSSKGYDSFDINLLPDLHSKTANKNERI